MSSEGTLEQVAIQLARLLRPLALELAPGRAKNFFQQLGITLNDAQVASLSGPLSTTASRTKQLQQATGQLIEALATGNLPNIVERLNEVLQKISDIIESFSTVGLSVSGTAGISPDQVAKRIFDFLMFRYLEKSRGLNDVLEIAGLLYREDHNEDSIDPNNPPFTVSTYHFDRITGWFSNPFGQLQSLYGWGDGFNGTALFSKIEQIVGRNGLPVIYDTTGPVPKLDLVLFEAVPKLNVSPHGLTVRLKSKSSTGVMTIPIGSDVKLDIKTDIQPPFKTEVDIFPNGKVTIRPPSPGPSLSGDFLFKVTARRSSPPEPFVLFGATGGSRLELTEFIFTTGTRATWSGSSASGSFLIGADTNGLKAIIDTTESDGFLSKILPSTKIEAGFDLHLGVSADHGLYFTGSSALEVQVPLHLDLGLAAIEALTLAAKLEGGEIPLNIGADIHATLGPLVAVVQNLGVTVTVSFAPGNKGNLGPLQFALGFKPPNGVGLAIEAGVVKGEGFLAFDSAKEEYAGALELTFSEFLTLKAIGLITTRMPDGSKGFSLLIIITAEFGSPIQLGFGFTLIAVGGLLGLNRTMNLEVIAEGVRTGTVENIMFPKDVIENAPRIISDMREFFPPAADIFLIGPMAKLGWGTPALVTVSLGIIIEIPPGNIAILGVLKVALPDDDAALIILQVNFIGALEPSKNRLWFFASMYESRIIFITLEGEMGLLVAWGDNANFVLSVGGFHPSFNPPPLPFPNPKRVSVSILNESFAKVRVEGYFAVTSNTVQFGARVEIFFGLSEFKIEGHLAFDALFQFSPFHFIITISASMDVKVFGVGLFSVHIRGELEGTSPWHIEGEGSISVLFFSLDVPFSHTWGQEEDTTLPPIQVMPLLEKEFNKLENWSAEPPTTNNLLVSLRKIEASENLVLHPVGILRISQRAVPLDLGLDKVGNQKPSDAKKIIIDVPNADLQRHGDIQEQFATAQFKELSDAQKLSSPAYEKQKAGVELSAVGEIMQSDAAVKRVVRYETIIIDNNFKEHLWRFFILAAEIFAHFLKGNAASRSRLSANYKRQKAPIDQKIVFGTLLYVVASNVDNSAFSANAQFTSHAKAYDFMQEQINKDPNLAQSLHVIPVTEMSTAP